MPVQRSNEDQAVRISKSIFVTNFPDNLGSKYPTSCCFGLEKQFAKIGALKSDVEFRYECKVVVFPRQFFSDNVDECNVDGHYGYGEAIIMGDFNDVSDLWMKDLVSAFNVSGQRCFDRVYCVFGLWMVKVGRKKSQLSIRGVFVEGTWCTDPSIVKEAFKNHFEVRFQQPCHDRLKLNAPFHNRLSSDQVDELDRAVSRDEIRRAVWNCGENKSLASMVITWMWYFYFAKASILVIARKRPEFPFCCGLKQGGEVGIGVCVLNNSFSLSGVRLGVYVSKWLGLACVNKLKPGYSLMEVKTLSIGGRLTLLKSVLGASPIYYMSIFKVPKGVLKTMESIRSKFFNGVDSSDRKISWVAWDQSSFRGTCVMELSWLSSGDDLSSIMNSVVLSSSKIGGLVNLSGDGSSRLPITRVNLSRRGCFVGFPSVSSLYAARGRSFVLSRIGKLVFLRFLSVSCYLEVNALVKNGTWLLVPKPAGVNMVCSMWLFKHKFYADGTLSRYKARLVANGSSQQLGVEFDETFSLVVKPATIRTVLSLAVSCQWPIHQLDVKNAFLNGDLSETVYMHQPPGFVDNRYPHHVCLLQRSLYGLKQAPRAWFQRFAGYATRAGFYHSRCDSSLFIYRQGSQVAYLLIYVDDIILTASCPALLQQIIGSLNNEFDMTDLGALNYFLGISADRTPTGLFLSQKKYALQLLERAHMVTCNPSRTPVDTESKLGPEVQQICLYMHDPREPHLAALKRILRYVQGTLDLGLHLYASSTTSLVGYTDADWAGCPSTRRSTSGYCVFLGDNLLSWSAKRQHTLSRSSAEAEYRGVANVVAKTAWLRNLLRELHSPLSTATLV
ncbi:ribonuclease H-like domain-containing protein [Tanacetum coccineum]